MILPKIMERILYLNTTKNLFLEEFLDNNRLSKFITFGKFPK